MHHARKGAGRVRAGQALRGSSEFHAWLDSALFLRRVNDDALTLTVEHRAEPSHGPIPVHLASNGAALALSVAESTPASSPPSNAPTVVRQPSGRIEAALADLGGAATVDGLRAACHMRTQTLCDALAELVRAGRVVKTDAGYQLAAP